MNIKVWAADDFEIFKRMMTQKNIDLQMQALQLIQQRFGNYIHEVQIYIYHSRYGTLPVALQDDSKNLEEDPEARIMEEVAR